MSKRILAVDDNKDILQALHDILEFYGYEVETLPDGNAVFESIASYHPDLILLDIMLDGLDGRDICQAIKTDETTHDIPVILISASHKLEDAMNQNGSPDDFIAKPFDINILIDKVSSYLAA
ncbi:response regulator [Pedobacter sp. HMF7647]|uniref:Response regulator n=1 Tax=Hufsiella arboris TaxID=2695275 RepID=A0A7K1Y6L8_9SPHI|nr:response regulator [Hufsiella arboris]MXV49769.1 response regulator [Hufsiella arboris]